MARNNKSISQTYNREANKGRYQAAEARVRLYGNEALKARHAKIEKAGARLERIYTNQQNRGRTAREAAARQTENKKHTPSLTPSPTATPPTTRPMTRSDKAQSDKRVAHNLIRQEGQAREVIGKRVEDLKTKKLEQAINRFERSRSRQFNKEAQRQRTNSRGDRGIG